MKWKVQLDNSAYNHVTEKKIIVAAQTEQVIYIDESFGYESLIIQGCTGSRIIFKQVYTGTRDVLCKVTVILEKDARLKHELVVNTTAFITCTYNFIAEKAGAEIISSGRIMLSQLAECKVNVEQRHHTAFTRSNLCFRTALLDQAQYTYNGLINIAEKAVQVSAYQEDKVLVVSPQATAQSVPSLQVLCNDVQCGHATAIAHINELHLFMLASRGLEQKVAKNIVMTGFLAY